MTSDIAIQHLGRGQVVICWCLRIAGRHDGQMADGVYQLGITSIDAFRRSDGPGLRQIAISLIEQLEAGDHERFEAIMKSLYTGLPAGDNVMNTSLGRYADAGDFTRDVVMESLDAGDGVSFHDMAVSNAITSVELFELLADRVPVSFLATDKFAICRILSTQDRQWKIVINADDVPLQYIGHGFVLSATRERRRFPVNRLLKLYVERRVLPALLADLKAGRIVADRVRQVSLFHPSARGLAESDGRFSLGVHDITSVAEPPADVVRMMGVVGGFAEKLRPSMLASVALSARDGGLVVLGDRRDRESTGMTIYRRLADRLSPVRHFERPYRFDELVCGLRLRA